MPKGFRSARLKASRYRWSAKASAERRSLLSEIADDNRQDRYDDDADRHQREIVLDHRHVPEDAARADAHTHPCGGANHVVGRERVRRHPRRAGDERDERADDWHETAHDDRLAAKIGRA